MTGSISKVAISVDVEDWYHGPTMARRWNTRHSLDRFLRERPGSERGVPYLDACLELLAQRNLLATFFWVAEYARRFPELLRRVAAAGHEIACHGLTHYPKWNPQARRASFSRAEYRERTQQARAILQDLSGQPVVGYRAPNAYLTGEMLDDLEALGFRYDSSVSVNSFYNKTGARLAGVDTRPYFPVPGGLTPTAVPRGIIEFPWPYYQAGGLRIQSAGGPYLRFFGSELIIRGIRQSLARGHTLFYFHPVDLCREDIPMPFSFRRPFLWALKGDFVRRRVARVLDAFRDRAVCFRELLG